MRSALQTRGSQPENKLLLLCELFIALSCIRITAFPTSTHFVLVVTVHSENGAVLKGNIYSTKCVGSRTTSALQSF